MILEEIPLIADAPDQLLDVVLSGNPYTLRVLWNETHGYWALSIYEREGDVILSNIKMVKDYPLIGRFKDTRLPEGEIYFIDTKGKNTRPLFESIGTGDHVLIYHVPDAVTTTEQTVITATAPVSGSIWDSGLTVFDGGASTWD